MSSLQTYFDLYQFPTGRRLFAMQRIAELASERDLPDIRQLAEAAVAQATQAADLETAWRRSRSTDEGRRKRASQIDNQLDRMLGGMNTQLGGLMQAFGDTGLGAQAQRVSERLFPEGASAITNMSFESELAATEAVLRELRGPLASEAQALTLGHFVEGLAQLAGDFRAALSEETTREVSYDQVRQALTEGQEAMLRVVATILGRFAAPDQAEARQALMAPVMTQNRRMGERFSSRRPPSDVDPQTGEDLDAQSAVSEVAGDAG